MKSLFLITSLLWTSISAYAALSMKPGKWKMEIKTENKANDPIAKMQEAMKKMTPEQKKQMNEMMKKFSNDPKMKDKGVPNIKVDHNGMTICYTKEMLENGLDLKKKQEANKCKMTDQKLTSTMVNMKFKCENGSSGETEWKVLDQTHMTGFTKIHTAKGKISQHEFIAEFISEKCD